MSIDSTTIKSDGCGRLSGPVAQRFLLIVYLEQSSRVLELAEGEEIVVGRGGPDVNLPLEDSKISRRHARLWREGNNVFVEDLGSTNGTRVNEVNVQGRQRLGPGDEVGLGSATLVVSSLVLNVGSHRLLSEGEFEERLDAEVDRAKRYRRPLSLLMLRFSGPAEGIRKRLSAIAAVLRRMDLLACYGPREYALLFPEADEPASMTVIRRVVQASQDGASDKITVGCASLPADAHSPGMLIEIARARLRDARVEPHPTTPTKKGAAIRRLVAESRSLLQVLNLAHRIGGLNTTVLILGETGSGKQVVAEEIHRSSARAKGSLVHVNCAAIPPALLESELFGHERGAFTGADSRHVGYVEAATGGTLFLDEIGELPEQAQPKLLHFLESQTFSRVGGVKPLQGNVRILAATNRDLEAEVKGGRFREDLFFRLSTFVLHVPPLRERLEDIEPLARQFCEEFATSLDQPVPELSPHALEALKRYSWPGNVRQLRNAIERAVVLAEGSSIEQVHLPERVVMPHLEETTPVSGPLAAKLTEVEAKSIETMLRECGGNQSEAARRLGITRRSLIYRMQKLGLR